MEQYSTNQGDTWDIIAQKVYGDEKQMIALMRVNPSWIRTVFFPAGVILEVPMLAADDIPAELPPWKQGDTDAE